MINFSNLFQHLYKNSQYFTFEKKFSNANGKTSGYDGVKKQLTVTYI
jgi:hypothetical protein